MIRALHKYLVLSTWTLVSFIAFQPLVLHRKVDENSNNTLATVSNVSPSFRSRSEFALISGRFSSVQVLFGFFLCSLVVGGEKLVIQFIACKLGSSTYPLFPH
jgi:hypothetical protein